MSDDAPSEGVPSPSKTKKNRKGCLKRLGIFSLVTFAILLGIALWLNGPGFRLIAHKYGPDLLTKQGIQAEFQLSGTLWHGPNIDSIHLSSETTPLKTLTAKNLQLRYRPFALKKMEIDSLTADSLTIELDFSQSTPKEKEAEPPEAPKSLAELLANYRPIAIHPEIHIAELNLHLHQGEQNFYRLQEAGLHHASGSGIFELSPGKVTDFENKIFSPELAQISWGEGQLTVTELPLTHQLSVSNLLFAPEPLALSGQISAYGSLLEISTNLRSEVTASLGPQALDLRPFLELTPTTQDSQGKLSELQITASQLDQDFAKWNLDLSLTLQEIDFQGRALPLSKLEVIKNGLELDTTLRVELPGDPQEINLLTNFEADTAQTPATAWKNSSSDLTTELASLSAFLTSISPILNLPHPPDRWPEGRALLLANTELKEGEPTNTHLSLSFNGLDWAEARFQKGELTIDYLDSNSPIEANLTMEQNTKATLVSKANFHPKTQAYAAHFSATEFDADTLQPFIRLSVGDFPLSGIISLDWEGTGKLPDLDSHRGSLSLKRTRLAIQEQAPIELALQANYEGLSKVEIPFLRVQQDDQSFETQISWDGKRVTIPKLSLVKAEQELATGELSLPYALDTDLKNYLATEQAWTVQLDAEKLDIPETAQLFALSIPEDLQGQLSLKVDIAGSPAQPSLAGRLNLNRFSLENITHLPTTDATIAWNTTGKTFALNGTLQPEGRNSIVVTGSTAFEPAKWTQNPDSLLDESFDLRIDAPNVRLEPFSDLSPLITRLEGQVEAQVQANGTFRTPNLTGFVNLDLPKARFDIDRLRRVRNTKLQATFANNKIRLSPFSTSVDGGLLDLTGTVDVSDTSDPKFYLKLGVEKALVWRNENINARTDAAVFLTGSLSNARLSGELAVVESLFYKDIELLPLNVPVSIPKPPSLPAISKRPANNKKTTDQALPIPEPFASWTLDLRARTDDPFLIRGNLTSGEVMGELTATGKLADPRLEGELRIKDLNAALPFSSLTIDGGRVFFNPRGGFIPKLDIRAQSRIPPYEIDIFVAGPATSPSISFASNPPLPESEVITLLATGSTSAGLEDADAAKGKAFQLLIEQIRRAPPGSPLHPLARFAEPLKDVELQVGGTDPFTGKRRNSVTLPVPNTTRWFITAAADSESNTRGLVLYLLKFD